MKHLGLPILDTGCCDNCCTGIDYIHPVGKQRIGNDKITALCHVLGMAKKKKTGKRRVTTKYWVQGQPFPDTKAKKKDDVQNALDVVAHAIGEALVPPKQKKTTK